MSRMTMEQKRARDAWEKAGQGLRQHGKDYMNDAKALPALIMNSGLMQVMAFLEQKGGRHATLGQHLRQWLHQTRNTPAGFGDFMKEMMQADSRKYQAVTTEAFAWLRWLRQMAAARQGGGQ